MVVSLFVAVFVWSGVFGVLGLMPLFLFGAADWCKTGGEGGGGGGDFIMVFCLPVGMAL